MKEFEEIEKELKEIEGEGLEKLTIDELNQKQKEILKEREQYRCESNRKQRIIAKVITVNRIIDSYKKEGFKGVYKYMVKWNTYWDPEKVLGYSEDEIPF